MGAAEDSWERSIGGHTIGKSVWSMVVFPFVNVSFCRVHVGTRGVRRAPELP